MADPLKLKKGSQVVLLGLKTELLNGAEGRIIGPADPESGRFPVKLKAPEAAAAAYPEGVKIKPENLQAKEQPHNQQPTGRPARRPPPTQRAPPTMPQQHARTHMARDAFDNAALGERPPPASWASGLSRVKQAEWLIDCYRMRVDDDYQWGGGNLHGLYDPDSNTHSIVLDFLAFAKLAVRASALPPGWDWGACLAKAAGLLGYAFEKDDARQKYGSENVFAAFTGGRSLRATGEEVYGTSVMAGEDEESEAMEQVNAEIGHVYPEDAQEALDTLLRDRPELFADVGGAAAWQRLRDNLEMPRGHR